MPLIASIDGPNRRIYLSADTVGVDFQPMDVYKEMRTLRRTDETLRNYDVFLSASGNVSKGGGAFTPRLVTCLQGTRIVPYDTTQELTVIGEIITDDEQSGTACFDRTVLNASTVVDINYQPPQVEIIQVSTGGVQQTTLDQVLAILQSMNIDGDGILEANIKKVNDLLVSGSGTTNDPWGPQ